MLKKLKEKLQELLKAARAIAAKAEDEERDFSGEERSKITELLEEARDLKAKIKQAEDDDAVRDEIKALSAEFEGAHVLNGQYRAEPGQQAGGNAQPSGQGTIGERFVSSEAFKAWMKRVAPSGRIPDNARGLISPPVEFKSLLPLRKDLITGVSDTSGGAFVVTDYTGIYEPLGRYPLNVLDLINRRQTTSDLVEFVRQTQRVQEAAPVPEANVTEYSGATGEISGEKPEGAMAFEKVQEAVKTVAVWIPATKRALSDASQIRGLIDQELRDDLVEELENQIVNGNGVGENFTGIFNTAGILTQAWNTDILTTSRQALTFLRVTGRAIPSAWVIHPADWETIELLQDANNRYYWGGPLAQGRPQLWGVPVVQSQSLTQGTGLLGDFRKAVLWDREAASIQASDSHADFFIRNLVAILAEMRAAFGLIRPQAFVEVPLVEVGS